MPRLLASAALIFAVAAAPAADPPADEARRDALARYGVGILRARNDLPVQAVRQFETAAKADPAAAEPLRQLVKLYADLGRDAAAVRTARRVLELDPADADTAHALSKLLFDGRKFADAAAALRQAVNSPRAANPPGKRLGLLRDLARACEAADDWPGAEAVLTDAAGLVAARRNTLLKSPGYATPADLDREAAVVQEKLGHARLRQKKFADAEAAYREAHRLAALAGDPTAAARLDWHLSGVLADRGDVADALVPLARFLKLKPSGAAPYERYAGLLRRAGRPPADALARLADDNPANPAVHWVRASELGMDDPAAAETLFTELVDAPTADDPELFRRLVRFGKDSGRAGYLLATIDRVFRAARGPQRDDGTPDPAAPPVPESVRAKARVLAAAVRAEPGLTGPLLDASRSAGPLTADTWQLLAGSAERAGDLKAAEAALRGGVEVEKGGPSLALLDVLARQRKWRAVRDEATAAVRRSGSNTLLNYYVHLALANAELGQDRAALAALEPLANATKRAWAVSHRVRVLTALGRHPEAADECRKFLADSPPPADARQARVDLSTALTAGKDFAGAEAELRAVLDDDPDDALALNNLGYNLADQGRNLAEAEALIRRALELDRDDRLRAGHPDPQAGAYLDSLGWVLFRRGKLADARGVLEKAVDLPEAAGDPTVWDHLGDVRFRLGDRAGARTAWGEAAKLYDDSHVGRQGGRRDEVLRKLRQAE